MGAVLPDWADDIQEVQSYILEAQFRSMNVPTTAGTGEGVHIGIIDSAHELPDHFTEQYHVNQGEQNKFIDCSGGHSSPHCLLVFNQLSAIAENAEFSIYHAIDEKGKLRLGPYADAISKALDDGVDIVNISAGDPWRGPIQANPNVSETKRLLENGVTTVAAAGNYYPNSQDSKPPVHCPSAAKNVISVGSYATHCPRSTDEVSATSKQGPYFIRHDQSDRHATSGETFCGEQGCLEGESCITNQTESAWERNPLPTGDKPDVLTPMHIIKRDVDENPYIGTGTSYAAPLVAGSLGCIFGELRDTGETIPRPDKVRDAVHRSSCGLNSIRAGKYDAMGVRSMLGVV